MWVRDAFFSLLCKEDCYCLLLRKEELQHQKKSSFQGEPQEEVFNAHYFGVLKYYFLHVAFLKK
jgi:hypothetical protein